APPPRSEIPGAARTLQGAAGWARHEASRPSNQGEVSRQSVSRAVDPWGDSDVGVARRGAEATLHQEAQWEVEQRPGGEGVGGRRMQSDGYGEAEDGDG